MKKEQMKERKNFIWRKVLVIIFWLLVWEAAAGIIGNRILLEGPIGVIKRLFEDLQTVVYYKTVGASVLRIMAGLFAGVYIATGLGILSYRQKYIEEFLLPLIQFFKAAPITCFVVLLLIWTGSENLAFYISLLVTFPPIYFNLLEGLKQVDEKMQEVAKVYKMPLLNKIRCIYLPEIRPYFTSAIAVSVGMAFKAGIAAEIIGTPEFSMGERIYMSKIYLDTAGVLSWMITVIIVSCLCEKVIIALAKSDFERISVYRKVKKQTELTEKAGISLRDCTVSYGDEVVLSDININFSDGKVYAVTGQSGIGKTTLLKVFSGLKKADGVNVSDMPPVNAMVFQENRLCEDLSAIDNIFATGHCQFTMQEVENIMKRLLPKEVLSKPVKEYSGGMKRRVEIARAMLSTSNVILMDEPFTGLDESTKKVVIDFINQYRNNRMIIFTTHCSEDIINVKAEEFKL